MATVYLGAVLEAASATVERSSAGSLGADDAAGATGATGATGAACAAGVAFDIRSLKSPSGPWGIESFGMGEVAASVRPPL